MTWFTWVFLGVLQGLTEFLPVSSSGHLVLAQSVLGVTVAGVVLEVTVHVATALAVVVLYRRDLGRMLAAVARWAFRRRPGLRGAAVVREDHAWRGLAMNILLATLVTSAIGFGFQPFFRGAFEQPKVAAGMLLVTGAVLYASRWIRKGRRGPSDLGPADAFWVGIAQGLAILPGLSRSGLTIVGGLTRKLRGEAAARFAFLLAIPAVLGAALVETVGSGEFSAALRAGVSLGGLGAAFAAAFVAGLGAMVLLVRIVERGQLHRFAWYCWLAGGAALAWLYLAGGPG